VELCGAQRQPPCDPLALDLTDDQGRSLDTVEELPELLNDLCENGHSRSPTPAFVKP